MRCESTVGHRLGEAQFAAAALVGGFRVIERRPLLDFLSHAVVLIGIVIVAFPVYMTFVASTHTAQDIVQAPMPMLPGPHLIDAIL